MMDAKELKMIARERRLDVMEMVYYAKAESCVFGQLPEQEITFWQGHLNIQIFALIKLK